MARTNCYIRGELTDFSPLLCWGPACFGFKEWAAAILQTHNRLLILIKAPVWCSFSGSHSSFFHTVHYCRTSIHTLSEHSVLEPVSLRPVALWLVSSRRPEQAPPTTFLRHLCHCFSNHGRVSGVAEGCDCIVVTPHSTPDSLLKAPLQCILAFLWYFKLAL